VCITSFSPLKTSKGHALALSLLYVWSLLKLTIFQFLLKKKKNFSQESATSVNFLTAIF
jgi:hypothetical protein